MEELFERIAKANNEIKTITLKGKEYCEVKERVIAFRKVFPRGRIITDIHYSDNYVMAEAKIFANFPMGEFEDLLATANARELANKPFALENAETSAIGRALGFCGLGIVSSIASADDMQNLEDAKVFDVDVQEDKKHREEIINKFNSLKAEQKATILNLMKAKKPEDIQLDLLEEMVRNAK